MVQIEYLRYLKDKTTLELSAIVSAYRYYEHTKIVSVKVDTADSFNPETLSPSSQAVDITSKLAFSEDKNARHSVVGTICAADLHPLLTDASFRNKLLVVYFITDGNFTADVPCGMDSTVTAGIIFDKTPILDMIVNGTKELGDSCSIPSGFIDLLLKYSGIKYALLAEDWGRAVELWKRFFSVSKKSYIKNKCGCHDR